MMKEIIQFFIPFTTTTDELFGGRMWRWAFVLERGPHQVGIIAGFKKLLLKRGPFADIEPRTADYVLLSIRWYPYRAWRIGAHHIYYDGSNCMYCLGPVALSTSLRHNCPKCAAGSD
jgi:hypothetical protein